MFTFVIMNLEQPVGDNPRFDRVAVCKVNQEVSFSGRALSGSQVVGSVLYRAESPRIISFCFRLQA